MNLDNIDKSIVRVERAASDLRRGMPVLVCSNNNEQILISSPENINYINKLQGSSNASHKELLVSKTRIKYLAPDFITNEPVVINADNFSAEEIVAICSSYPFAFDIKNENIRPASSLEKAAFKFAKLSELIPAVLIFQINGKVDDEILKLTTDDIEHYQKNSHYNMEESCQAKLTLQNAENSKIIAYRPNIGGAEHYAIIVGEPGDEPLVRVHSSCYTGDLLASLACDCRDQLQSAIALMAKDGGGIILYLLQEGRGIGLVNKLRTYNAQKLGADTVEANQNLGFDDDERLFMPAAQILKKLGISAVKLLTNNPLKAQGLEECGIKVISCVPHIMESNQHNESYLQTKATKMGHKL